MTETQADLLLRIMILLVRIFVFMGYEHLSQDIKSKAHQLEKEVNDG